MRVGLVLAQRNEEDCIEPWVRYHSYLFGAENIYIIDNASDSKWLCDRLLHYESIGISVTRIPPGTPFVQRGDYTAALIREVTSSGNFDFFLPMDCDEFVYVKDSSGQPSCSRQDIEKYLQSYLGCKGVLVVNQELENINGVTGRYNQRPCRKTFFAGDSCQSLDLGFHHGKSRYPSDDVDTDICFLHYHWRPFSIYKSFAKAKLAPFVDVEDNNALRAYKDGPNHHVVNALLMSEQQYYQMLAGMYEGNPQVSKREFYGFSNVLKLIGIRPEFIDGKGWSADITV